MNLGLAPISVVSIPVPSGKDWAFLGYGWISRYLAENAIKIFVRDFNTCC